VFSSKFADIFLGNAGKQGLVTGVISDSETEAIWQLLEANPGLEAKVDLVAREVTVGDLTVKFEIDEYTRWRLLEGLDDIGLTLRDEQSITDFEARREPWRPKTLPAKGA
jgi:3-isopropylmalate/(R)-2-methylmalate dehydratase small subunit